jgi:hypothetical protein
LETETVFSACLIDVCNDPNTGHQIAMSAKCWFPSEVEREADMDMPQRDVGSCKGFLDAWRCWM